MINEINIHSVKKIEIFNSDLGFILTRLVITDVEGIIVTVNLFQQK